MRDNLRKKAWFMTILLSIALLALGFSLGRILPVQQAEEDRLLISQATEKVLALTQEKQSLEERLQGALAQQGGNFIWRNENVYYGLLRPEQGVVFNQELAVDWLGTQAGRLQLLLNWRGQKNQTLCQAGQKIDLANNWQLELAAMGPAWAVVVLRQPPKP